MTTFELEESKRRPGECLYEGLTEKQGGRYMLAEEVGLAIADHKKVISLLLEKVIDCDPNCEDDEGNCEYECELNGEQCAIIQKARKLLER